MPDWQERIDRETQPAIRAEHELRYAAAAPIVHGSAAWLDLGCGTGLAAAAGLGGTFEGHAILVDRDEATVAQARTTVAARDVTGLTLDLSVPEELRRASEALREAADGEPTCITCFETLEHLASFVPLVELLVELSENARCTAVLSVPNDAFWAIENPHHATTWGEGAVAELLSLLPSDHRRVQQVRLQGSALVDPDEGTQEVAMVSAAAAVSTHDLVVLGERRGELAITSRVLQTDLDEQRRWERQRESDLRWHVAQAKAAAAEVERLRTRVGELEAQLANSPPGELPPSAASASGGSA